MTKVAENRPEERSETMTKVAENRPVFSFLPNALRPLAATYNFLVGERFEVALVFLVG
jgi:hypothetical protein